MLFAKRRKEKRGNIVMRKKNCGIFIGANCKVDAF
jgi:hypothetical protein